MAAKTTERTYNVPLRKEFRKVPRWRKTKKAVTALREFLARHMKSDNIKLGKDVNEELWKQGIRNPPDHIKVNVAKNDKGEVSVSLFGAKKAPAKEEKKAEVKKEAKSPAKKPETKTEKKEETKKAEEKKAPAKKETKAPETKE